MQAAARRLDVVLEHLRARTCTVAFLHRPGPDPACDPPDYGVLRVHAIREEEAQVRREFINIHAACEVVLNNRKPIRQRKCELADRIRTCLRDVIAADGNAVVIADIVIDEELLHVTHHLHRKLRRENAGILRLVLLQDIGLHRAPNARQRIRPDARVSFRVDNEFSGYAKQTKAQSIAAIRQVAFINRSLAAFEVLIDLLLRRFPATRFTKVLLNLLVNCGIHEKRQNHRRGTVDRHGNRGCRRAEIETGIKFLHVINGCNRNTRVADFSIDIRTFVRVFAIQGYGIKSRREARRRLAL